jgi:hypothetical protein
VRTLVAVDPPIGYDYSLISSAAWSADGRWVAFEVFHCGGVASDAAGTGGLWVTNGQNEPRQLTRPCFEDPEVLHPAEVFEWRSRTAGSTHRPRTRFPDEDAVPPARFGEYRQLELFGRHPTGKDEAVFIELP